jgi:hypothetical protein
MASLFFLILLLFAGAGIALIFVLVRAGTRTETGPIADHLVFVDDRDHDDEELMRIYGIERHGAHFAYGRMARFDTLEAAIAYARTVPPQSRPRRR